MVVRWCCERKVSHRLIPMPKNMGTFEFVNSHTPDNHLSDHVHTSLVICDGLSVTVDRVKNTPDIGFS